MSDLQPRNNTRNVKLLASAISAIVGAGGIQSVAAQQQEADAAGQETVIVTGSRIQRRDFTASSPIMTVDAERLDLSSTLSVESVLNQMPQFVPAQTQFDAQFNIETSPTASLGIGSTSLRGVGTNRTLVLLDGRRAQPVNASLVVDLNTIPAAAIERIESITGGASAVYGADALAGVVNFILKDNFEGVSLDIQNGFTEAGDGEEWRFSSLLGMSSDSGNSNVMLGVEWYERNAAFQKNHDFYTDSWADETDLRGTFFPSMGNWDMRFAGPVGAPSQAAVDQVFSDYYGIAPGTIRNTGQQWFFNLDGTPFVRQDGVAYGFDFSQLGRPDVGDGFYGLIRRGDQWEQVYTDGPMSTPLERRSAFGKARVNINDNMRAFVQANFSRNEVSTYSAGPPPAYFGWTVQVPNDGREVPDALQTLLDSRDDPNTPENEGAAPWNMARGLDFLGNFGPKNSNDVYQVMAGVEGEFVDRDWTWEAYFSTGQTTTINDYNLMPSVQRYRTLITLPNWGAGDPPGTPYISPENASYLLSCESGVPIIATYDSTITPDCITAMRGGWKTISEVKQEILEANLQGGLIDMRGGELRFAAGVSTRENEFSYLPASPQSSIFEQPLGIFVSNPALGKTKVDEIYGELLVPLMQSLNLEVGYRYSDYDTSGSVDTYKALLDWSATDSVRVRGGYQLANRAPNTAELFQSGLAVLEVYDGDPCQTNTNADWGNVDGNPNRAGVQQICGALIGDSSLFGAPGSDTANNFLLGAPGEAPFTVINGIQSGNLKLESEEADTYTLGVVLQGVGGLDGLTASIDWYDIEVAGAIDTFQATTVYEQCFNVNGVSNPTYSIDDPGGFCGLIDRADSGGPGVVNLAYVNTGAIETSGVDVSLDWAKSLQSGGTFFINSLVTYIDSYKTQEKPGDPYDEWVGTFGEGGQFDYRINSTFGYNMSGGRANVGVRWRHLPEIDSALAVNGNPTNILTADSYNMFDLFAGFTFNDRYQLRGGIDNLLDEDPVVTGATATDSNSGTTSAEYYDTLGRRMYIGIKMVF